MTRTDVLAANEVARVVGADGDDNAAVTSRSGRGQADEWRWTLTPVVDILAGSVILSEAI
jgi:uncharacterized membrane protein